MLKKRLPYSLFARRQAWHPLAITMIIASVLLSGCTTKKTQLTSTTNLAKGAQIAKIPPEVLKNALNAFSQAKSSGQNLSNGPCLGITDPDWVLDIAHNPRQSIDDKVENQCEDYKNGKVHHFVEMDESGQIIQAR